MAKVKAGARPWRFITTLLLASTMAVVSCWARRAEGSPTFSETAFQALGRTGTEAVADAAAVAFCLLAGLGTAGVAGKARVVLTPKIGTAHAAAIRYAIVLLGGLATIIITLQLFTISVTQLLVGGAFASVLLAVAAQQSLSNLFAGLVLVFTRPVHVGDQVQITSGVLGGRFYGSITEIGITYLRMDTADGPLHLPNSQVLAAAVTLARGSPPGGQAPAAAPARSQNHSSISGALG